jgi:hypothetical protein
MTRISGNNGATDVAAFTNNDVAANINNQAAQNLTVNNQTAAPESLTAGVAAKTGLNTTAAELQLARSGETLLAQNTGGRSSIPRIPFNPYEGVSPQRQTQLNHAAQSLLDRYSRDGSLSFTDFGDMLNDISAMGGLNTREKANIWTTIANRKDNYNIVNDGLLPDNIDSFRSGTSAGHIVIGFNDGYHGPLANLTLDEAFNEIIRHEENEGGLVGRAGRAVIGTLNGNGSLNTGDATASLNQVRAFHAFNEGGFAAYADEWNQRFLGR